MSDPAWKPISAAPFGLRVDVLFVNETLVPPSCGILKHAVRSQDGSSWIGIDGGRVPARYVVYWRDVFATSLQRSAQAA